jgi:aquaporin TIP
VNLKALVSEFLGTFALIFFGVGSVALAATHGGLVTVALAHGLVIAVMASAVGAISGGHFNPAVSLGAYMGNKISLINLVAYWISQLAGAIVGAWLIHYAFAGVADVHGTPGMIANLSMAQGFTLEAIGTFFLVFVVYGTAIDRRAPKMGALFIGLTITICICAFGPVTGSSINPARFLGPALVEGDMKDVIVYILGPLTGGALAGLLYNYFLADRDPEMPTSTLAP